MGASKLQSFCMHISYVQPTSSPRKKSSIPSLTLQNKACKKICCEVGHHMQSNFRPNKFSYDFQSTVQTTQPARRYYYTAPLARVHSRYHSHKPCRCGLRYCSLRWFLLHSALRMQARFDTAGLHLLQPMLVLHITLACRHGAYLTDCLAGHTPQT